MSRLSLKPGGEPGRWELKFSVVSEMDYTFLLKDIPDSDLMDIRSTINEYLDAKYEVVELDKPKRNWWKVVIGPLWWALLGSAACVGGFIIGWNRVPTISPSTGGVIDQLCMRPDIECSTSIRYVHPQAGVPHQERETYSADSLSQAHLEEQ